VCGLPFGSLKGEGEITGAKTATATLTLSVCKGFNNGCTAPKTPELEGKPVYVNSKREVGIVFQRKGVGNFAEFSCGTGAEKETIKVRGSVIATVIPLNVEVKTLRFGLAQAAGVQRPTEYENDKHELVKAVLEMEGSGKETFAFEQTGLATSSFSVLTAANLAMIEAVLTSSGKPEFRLTGGGSFSRVKFEGAATPSFSTETALWSFFNGSISGWITGPNEVAGVVFNLSEGSAGACYTNPTSKLYVTNELIGRIGYINKAAKTVGLLLEPTVDPIAKCQFRANLFEHLGSVIGEVKKGVNENTTQFRVAFRQEQLVNKPEKLEGEAVAHDLEYTSEGPGAKKLALEGEPRLTVPQEMKIEA
jgi:hypothetical protein